MARPKNTTKTVTVAISTTPAVRSLLESVVEYGTYGKNVAEAADRLLSERLNELLRGDDSFARILKVAHERFLSERDGADGEIDEEKTSA